MPLSRPLAGAGAIILAFAFNVPYTILALTFDYPGVLRRPPGEVLGAFASGGDGLVLTWYAFMLCALALVPMALALSLTRTRVSESPALAVGAAIAGTLAGLTQAIGLSRWVFAVPELARAHADAATSSATRDAITQAFVTLNGYGGVAIGEHLGQWLTALFVLLLAARQRREGRLATATMGFATAASIAVGTGEGLALALARPGETFALFTIAGYLGLSAWLVMTGWAEWRPSMHST